MTARRDLAEARADLRYGDLDRDLVVVAVLRLAQGSSLTKVTMRALAAELGTSPAALYYHVKDRGALLDLACESVLGHVKIPDSHLTWDEQLRVLYTNARQAMLPVNGIAAVLQSRPLAPSGWHLNEIATGILQTSGFTPAAARAAKMALSTFLLGAVALEQSLIADQVREGSADTPTVFRGRDFTAGLDIIIAGLKYRREKA
jgi:TetR/AcrR family tetracycline transcriptional repressor